MKNNHQADLIRQIGENIREGRIACGLSQEAFAEAVNLSRRFISSMENGTETARIETYYRVACGLGISLSDLFRVNSSIELSDEVMFLFHDCSEQEARALLEILRTVKAQLRTLKAANV